MIEKRKRGWHKVGWNPPNRTPQSKIDEIEDLFSQGYMQVQIKEIVGLSQMTVNKYISRYIDKKLDER